MPPIPPSRQLYDRLSQDPRYKGIGNSYESFVSYFSQPTNAQKLYGTLSKDTRYKGVGKDFNSFSTYFQLGHAGNNDNPAPAPQPPANNQLTTDDAALSAMFPKQKDTTDNVHIAQAPVVNFVKPKFDKPEDNPYVKEAIDDAVIKKNKLLPGVPLAKADMNLGRKEIIDAYKNNLIAPERNAQTGRVEMKPTGNFLQIFNDKYNEAFFNGVVDDYLAKAPKDEVIKFLNNANKVKPLYESQYAPKSMLGEGAGWLGTQADFLIGATAGGAAATLAMPETLGASAFGAFVTTAPHIATSSYSQGLKQYYSQIKAQNPNMSDSEAFDKAHNSALASEGTGLLTNAVLSGSIFGNEATAPAANGFMNALKASTKHIISTAPKSIAVGASSPILNDLAAAANGVKVDANETLKKSAQQAQDWAILHTVMGAVTGAPDIIKSIPSYVKPQATNVAASLPREEVRSYLEQQEANGEVPQGTSDKVINDLQQFDKTKQSIPANIPMSEETRAAITGKMIQRNNIKKEIAALGEHGEAFADKIEGLKKQVSNIEADINQMSLTNKPFDYETDNLTGEPLTPKKGYDNLSSQEKGGIVVPKEYGGADVLEVKHGDGESTYKATPYTIEKEGALEKRNYLDVEDKKYSDKAKAQEAADKALAQHYYENGMHDGLKPLAKEEKIKEDEKAPDNSATTESNERQPSEKEGSAITGLNQEVQPTEESKGAKEGEVGNEQEVGKKVSALTSFGVSTNDAVQLVDGRKSIDAVLEKISPDLRESLSGKIAEIVKGDKPRVLSEEESKKIKQQLYAHNGNKALANSLSEQLESNVYWEGQQRKAKLNILGRDVVADVRYVDGRPQITYTYEGEGGVNEQTIRLTGGKKDRLGKTTYHSYSVKTDFIPDKPNSETNTKGAGQPKQEVANEPQPVQADTTPTAAVESPLPTETTRTNQNSEQANGAENSNKKTSDSPSVGNDEAKVLQPEQSKIQTLRGERDNRLRRVEEQLQAISARYGGEANPEAFSRKDRQQWELLQRELQVGIADRASKEQEHNLHGELHGQADADSGIVGDFGSSPKNTKASREQGNDGRAGNSNASDEGARSSGEGYKGINGKEEPKPLDDKGITQLHYDLGDKAFSEVLDKAIEESKGANGSEEDVLDKINKLHAGSNTWDKSLKEAMLANPEKAKIAFELRDLAAKVWGMDLTPNGNDLSTLSMFFYGDANTPKEFLEGQLKDANAEIERLENGKSTLGKSKADQKQKLFYDEQIQSVNDKISAYNKELEKIKSHEPSNTEPLTDHKQSTSTAAAEGKTVISTESKAASTDQSKAKESTPQEPPSEPPVESADNNSSSGDGFTRINKAALKEDYGFTKNFESKSDQSVANEAMRKLHERAADNGITPQQQAANEVAAMKHKTGESSEHDIVTAAYHLMNLDEQISKVKDDFTEGLLLQQREDALTTLRQLGNNAGRNLRLFSVAYKKVAEGAIDTARRQLRRDLGIEELPKTVKDLDKSNLTAADKKKVRPYVETIEQLEKDLKDINKKAAEETKDIDDKDLQEAIKKAYEQGKKDAQSFGNNKKKSDKLRDFAKKIRESDTLDKLGLGKSAAGDAQANGFSFNAKEALAKTIELIADGMDKVEAITKAIKENGGKASKEFTDLVDTALAKLSLRDKEEVAGDIKALAASEQSTTITKEMVQQNLIYDFVKQHIFSDTPYEQVIKTATDELKQYLPDVNEKTVADAFVKRGEFKPETKQQVQTEMKAKESDVKRLALSELKLRALEAANDIHNLQNDTKLSAEEKKKAIEARKSTYEKQVDYKIKAIEEKKARIIENAKQAKAEYRKLETERNRQLAKVQALKEKIANFQKGIRPESTKKTTEPDTPEIEALKKQAKEEEKKLNEMESAQRKQLRQSLSEQDELYSLEQESKRVKAEKTIFANATKSPKKASAALTAARKQMEQAYSEAGIRPEKQNKKDIQIYKEAEDAIKEIEQNSALTEDVKKEHIATITADRDAQLNLTKQGVLINLKTAIDSHVADLADRIKTAKADGDTEAAQHLQDIAKDLSDMSQRLKPNGENLKDQIDKADQDIVALIKSSKGTPSESELEDLHTAFVADWQKTYDELQRQQLLKQKESQLRAIQRRFNAGSYSQVESTPFDIQRDKVLAEQDAQIKKAYTRLNALSEMAKKDTRSFADKALDVRKQWLIATFSAIEKVAGSAVTKPFIDAGNKQTFGRISGAITGIKPVELGMVKDTFRQMRNSESAGKFMQQRNNAYVDALVNYEQIKAQHGEDAPQTKAALKAMQTAELKHAASLAYLYINAGSHIDIKQIMLNAATDLDASLAKYNKKYAGEMGKWEKVGYWLESVNRTHGAMKSVSARQALLDGYIENLQYFQKQGEPLDVDTRKKAWDMAANNEYEQGRFSEATKTSNFVAKLKSHENAWIRRPANFLVPVSKISINITKQGIDRAMPLEVMYRTLGKDAAKGMKLNTADGVEFSNFASKYYNGIKRGFNELPLEQKKYINTLMARGLAGLTQYALVGYLLHSGAIKYGGAYNDNDPFKKKYGQVMGADGQPLGNGEWEFGGHRAPKLLNAIINHSPYSLPASLAADTHWQMERPDGKGTATKAIWEILNETYQRLPFATAVDLFKGTVLGDEYKLERTVANVIPSSKGAAELMDSDPKTGEARKVDTKGDSFWETTGKMIMQNTPGLRNMLPTKEATGSTGSTTGRNTGRTTSRSTGRSTGRSH